jgi:hypothetical protein
MLEAARRSATSTVVPCGKVFEDTATASIEVLGTKAGGIPYARTWAAALEAWV